MGLLQSIDNFFLSLEKAKPPVTSTAKGDKGGLGRTNPAADIMEMQSLDGFSSIIRSLKNSEQSLNGAWADNKEEFKKNILSELKTFIVTKWEKPWKPAFLQTPRGKIITGAVNLDNRRYRQQVGLKANLIECPYFATKNEIIKRGGRILDGKKGIMIVMRFKLDGQKEDEQGNVEIFEKFCAKFDNVYNLADTTCKIPKFTRTEYKDNQLNRYIESVINIWKKHKQIPTLKFDRLNDCYFLPNTDEIHVVDINQYDRVNEYYSTLFHEIVHSTKLRKTKDNKPVRAGFGSSKFGTRNYAREELVAEFGAYIICCELGLEYTRNNTLSYLKSWSKRLSDDDVLESYAQATEAADFLLENIEATKIINSVVSEAPKKPEPKDSPKKPEPKDSPKKPEPKDSPKKPEPKEPPKKNEHETYKPVYFPIDEGIARRAKNLNSFSDYAGGSTTEDYKKEVARVYALVNSTREDNRERAADIANQFAKKYADWVNKKNAIDCRCPSIMITGAGNFPTRKKEKQNAARDRHWQLYDEIYKLVEKIENLSKNHAISSSDSSAIVQLEAKVEKLQKRQGIMKDSNAYYRKHKTMVGFQSLTDEEAKKIDEYVKNDRLSLPYPRFMLSNNLAKIKQAQNRIAEISKIKSSEEKKLEERSYVRVEQNKEEMRLQLFFEGKPSPEVRNLLKHGGYKWSPRNSCWQRQLTDNAMYAFKNILLPKLDKLLGSSEDTEQAKEGEPNTFTDKDLYPFVAKDELINPMLLGVYHEKGFLVASNSIILAKVKADYPKELEGKSISIKNTENKGAFPRYENLLTKCPDSHTKDIDFASLLEACQRHTKVMSAANHYTDGTNRIKIDDVYFDARYMVEICKLAIRLGAAQIELAQLDRCIIAVDDNVLLIMPCQPPRGENTYTYFDYNSNEIRYSNFFHEKTDKASIVADMRKEADNLQIALTDNLIMVKKLKSKYGQIPDEVAKKYYIRDSDLRRDRNKLDRCKKNLEIVTELGGLDGTNSRLYYRMLDDDLEELVDGIENPANIPDDTNWRKAVKMATDYCRKHNIKYCNLQVNRLDFRTMCDNIINSYDIEPFKKSNALDGTEAEYLQNKTGYKKPLMGIDAPTSAALKLKRPKRLSQLEVFTKKTDFYIQNEKKSTPKSFNENSLGFVPISHKEDIKTEKLGGELGKFIGEFDRNCFSIVLRGDKGAGKSRLLYQLINAFAFKKLKIGFFSLEMGRSSSVTQRYKDEYITPVNLRMIDISTEAPTYEELNRACKLYDVVAIDSWTKLKGMEQTDFDRLQKENPKTILLVIFQSTTGKVTRGGNMPEYDGGIVIQVNKGGIAICEKNRYADTQIKYSVFERELIADED